MKQKILLVADDDEMMRNMIKRIFRKEDYELLVAEDGQEALEKFNESKPGVVLLDLNMPRLDGIGFLKEVRPQEDSPFQVIVISGHIEDEVFDRCLKNGAKKVLHKPFEPSSLKEAVRVCFEQLEDA